MRLRVAQFGVGPIGLETLKLAASKPWAHVIGAVDVDPAKAGRDLGELTGIEALRGRRVYSSLDLLVECGKPDLVFHTSVSRLAEAVRQITPIVGLGINVVSSCEELIFPELRDGRLARQLDSVCRRAGARVVAAGVNPGFVMDLVPVCLTGVSREVRSVRIERVVDASTRREPLQRKIGSGMEPKDFRRLLRSGAAGHAGLRESLALVAHSLGWKIQSITEHADAVIAGKRIRTRFFDVQAGQTCGIHQSALAKVDGKIRLTLDLQMFLGAPDPHDRVTIMGDPPLDVMFAGGVAGDPATVAALVNTGQRLMRAEPGLLLATDLPLPRLS